MAEIKYPTLEEFENDAGDLLEDLVRVFEDKELARKWFYNPSIGLNNESPYAWHRKGKTEEVRDYLGRIEYGVYS